MSVLISGGIMRARFLFFFLFFFFLFTHTLGQLSKRRRAEAPGVRLIIGRMSEKENIKKIAVHAVGPGVLLRGFRVPLILSLSLLSRSLAGYPREFVISNYVQYNNYYIILE